MLRRDELSAADATWVKGEMSTVGIERESPPFEPMVVVFWFQLFVCLFVFISRAGGRAKRNALMRNGKERKGKGLLRTNGVLRYLSIS